MKILRNIFDKQRKHFSDQGKLKHLKPLFDATETFFFIPGIPTQVKPFVRDSIDLKRFMISVMIALIPPFFFGIYNTGYQSNLASGFSTDFISSFINGSIIVMPIVIVTYAVGFFWELLFAIVKKHPISEGLLITGLLFPLTLPPTIPLWQVAVGITFGVVIGKEIFGGTGRNIFNPALTARAFLFFAYPAQMSGDAIWVAVKGTAAGAVDAVTAATPLACTTLTAATEKIEATLGHSGYTFLKLFSGMYPGSIGATSTLCCILGALFLIITGIASYKIMAGGVLGVLFAGLLLNILATPESLPWFSINPFYHLVAGGFAFGIVYMATDPVSAPGMEKSKWIYGFFIGMLTVLIRVLNPAFPEGIMLAILFMNVFSALLDHCEISLKLKKRIPNV